MYIYIYLLVIKQTWLENPPMMMFVLELPSVLHFRGILLGYSLFKFGLSSQWNTLSPWPKFDSSWDASQTWQKDNFIDSNMENHRTREPFFLLNMRNNKRNTLFVPSFCHMCVRFSSLVDLVGSIFFYCFALSRSHVESGKIWRTCGFSQNGRQGLLTWNHSRHLQSTEKNSK